MNKMKIKLNLTCTYVCNTPAEVWRSINTDGYRYKVLRGFRACFKKLTALIPVFAHKQVETLAEDFSLHGKLDTQFVTAKTSQVLGYLNLRI